jgi:chromosome partitioning protein
LLHFTRNALWASEYVIIPLEPEPLAFEGLRQFIGSILPNMILHNPNLRPGGALLVHRAPQTRKYLPDQIRYQINTHYPGLLFKQEIRFDQELAKMAYYNQPACQYAPGSNGSLDYASFVVEFESRIPP